jgi:hypothetical protein
MVGAVVVEVLGVDAAGVLGRHPHLPGEERRPRHLRRPGPHAAQGPDQAVQVVAADPLEQPAAATLADGEPATAPGASFPFPFGIPIYPRDRYWSYLKVTNIQRPPILTSDPCQLTLTAQEYVYTQPPAGSFDGSFPAAPGTRTVTIVLDPKPPALGFASSYVEATLYEAGVAQGSFTMGWVSPSFRRATVEVDTLVGSVAPSQSAPRTSAACSPPPAGT